jgi:septal ring factor EnvC (AmiA/AmiB activator)
MPTRRIRGGTPIRVVALLAAGAVVLAGGATGCVSTLKYDQLQQERDALQAKNEALKNEVDKSTKEAEALAQEKSALENQKGDLQAKLQNSQSKGSELDTKLHDTEEEKKKLQDTYDGLVKDLKKELKATSCSIPAPPRSTRTAWRS